MLVNMREMLKEAKAGGYAAGAFNFKEYSDLKSIAEAAEENDAPVILMSTSAVAEFFGVKPLVYAYRGLCEDMSSPCALHLDHAKDFELIKKCVETGYTSVMIDASEKSFDENVELTKRVVDIAKRRGVSVEAELGRIPGKEDDIAGFASEFVDPGAVAEFVAKTGVDALAIAIGTAHGFYKKAPDIRFDLIEATAAVTDVPLVMHGGTGLTEQDFIKAIASGISKVNVGTELKRAFSDALVNTAAAENAVGIDPMDYMKPVRESCKKIVASKMKIFGCAGVARRAV